MATHDYVISNQSFPSTRTDINNVLAAIVSNNSSATAPTTTFANMIWYDTSVNKLYIRNEDNDAWIELFVLDQTGDHLEKIGDTITLDGTGNMSLAGDLTVDTNTLFVDSTNDNVGVGTTSPDGLAHVYNGMLQVGSKTGDTSIQQNANAIRIASVPNTSTEWGGLQWYREFSDVIGAEIIASRPSAAETDTDLIFKTSTNSSNAVEVVRLDHQGNLLVGTTDVSQFNNSGASPDTGVVVAGTSYIDISRVDNPMLFLNRCNTKGDLIQLYNDGVAIGQIGAATSATTMYISSSQDGGLRFTYQSGSPIILPCDTAGGNIDNSADLGASSVRFRDVYSAGGVTTTSDQNEKQQIASLTDAEITAAKAISKLFKTFKWNDSVESKGDNARTHTGHIAQEVQQAMTDAGLDAGNYAFWCSNTWWTHEVEVPAVEAVEAQDAVLDDDGNIVTEAVEAVEAKDAYTRTDYYDTADEAPEGATERTRLGMRYHELLAFIGAATEQRLADIETRLTALEA